MLWFDSRSASPTCSAPSSSPRSLLVRRRRPADRRRWWPPASHSPTAPGRSTPRRPRSSRPGPLPRAASSRCAASPRSSRPLAARPLRRLRPRPASGTPSCCGATAVPFGTKDPQFGLDIGFFVFTLPWLRFVVGFLTMVARHRRSSPPPFTHYSTAASARRPAARAPRRPPACTCRSSLAALVLVRAAQLLARPLHPRPPRSRPTDHRHPVHRRRTRCMPDQGDPRGRRGHVRGACSSRRSGPAPGGCRSSASACSSSCVVAVGGIYPALVQRFKVQAVARSRSRRRTSSATSTRPGRRTGCRRRDATRTTPRPTATPRPAARRRRRRCPASGSSTPTSSRPTFKQLQAGKGYYQFPDVLDVDRYPIDGKLARHRHRGPRARPQRPARRAAQLAQRPHRLHPRLRRRRRLRQPARRPTASRSSIEQNIPPAGPLGDVRAAHLLRRALAGLLHRRRPQGRPAAGVRLPGRAARPGRQNTTYTGTGGVAHRRLRRARLAYAIKYREMNFLLSDAVNDDSRLLDHRTPRERVQRVAPWLTLDGNAYPAVVDGRVQWILDGYTTSADYPYSRAATLDRRPTVRLAHDALAQRPGGRRPARSTTSATRSRPRSTPTTARSRSTRGTTRTRCSRRGCKTFPGTVQPLSRRSAAT